MLIAFEGFPLKITLSSFIRIISTYKSITNFISCLNSLKTHSTIEISECDHNQIKMPFVICSFYSILPFTKGVGTVTLFGFLFCY